MKCSRRTVQRAVDVLVEDRWIEVRQIGENGTVNAHIINDRVAWSGKRDGIRYSLFTAAVIVSDEEQPDRDQIDHQAPFAPPAQPISRRTATSERERPPPSVTTIP